jgi:hypothetical protein
VLGYATFTGRIDNGTAGNAGTVLTVTALAAGAIQLGQTITGAGVTSTYITGQISGTPGGIGVYSVYTSQNVPATAITAAPATQTMLSLMRGGRPIRPGATDRADADGRVPLDPDPDEWRAQRGHHDRAEGHPQNYLRCRDHSFYMSMGPGDAGGHDFTRPRRSGDCLQYRAIQPDHAAGRICASGIGTATPGRHE